MGHNEVHENTQQFIVDIVENQASPTLSVEDNAKIETFFQGFLVQELPLPIVEGVEIPLYDVFTDPVRNENMFQYISVQYVEVDETKIDTNVYFEYIAYTSDGNIAATFFGQIVVRSDDQFVENEIISVRPMERQ